jgi:DNA-directed RNA polymerase specialized sigma24 family protein
MSRPVHFLSRMERPRSLNQPDAQRSFQTTRWSVVRRAVGSDDATAPQALAALCEAYWYPLYAYVRRSGYGPHDAEDLTQGFFARLLEKNVLATADPEKGKLRTFLLACAGHFLADERDRAMAEKRGAGLIVSFDPAMAEERYSAEPADDLSPDRLFQRRWALTILEYSLELLAEEFATQGKADVFETLRPFLGFGADPAQRYEEIAAAMGTPVGTLKNQVFRLRKRWRELLFEQVAMTLDNPTPDGIKGELAELLGCV